MSWMGPNKCEDHCCTCDPPVVTCYAWGGVGTPEFDYEVSNAASAWIQETDSGGAVTEIDLVLVDGAVSGSHPIDQTKTYCVYAANSCAEVRCCDICELPYGTIISAECTPNPDFEEGLPISASNQQYLDSITVNYRYRVVNPVSGSGVDSIVEADVNGISVFGSPSDQTGTVVVPNSALTATWPSDFLISPPTLPTNGSYLYIRVKNLCNNVAGDYRTYGCLQKKNHLRVSIAGLSNVDTTFTGGPFGGISTSTHRVKLTGLGGLNGTWLMPTPNCGGHVPFEYDTGVTVAVDITSRYNDPIGSNADDEYRWEFNAPLFLVPKANPITGGSDVCLVAKINPFQRQLTRKVYSPSGSGTVVSTTVTNPAFTNVSGICHVPTKQFLFASFIDGSSYALLTYPTTNCTMKTGKVLLPKALQTGTEAGVGGTFQYTIRAGSVELEYV